MRTRPRFFCWTILTLCWVRTGYIGNKQGHELAIERLEAKPSEMRELWLIDSGLDDEWAAEFARRALPNMPKLERLE